MPVPVPHSAPTASGGAHDMPRLNLQYVPNRLPAGVVTGLWGDAVMRQDDSSARALQLGDVVRPGDVLLTRQNGIVEISLGEDRVATNVRPPEALDGVIAGLEQGDPDAVPGAGLTPEDGSLRAALVVDRIVEVISPQEYQFAYDRLPPASDIELADPSSGLAPLSTEEAPAASSPEHTGTGTGLVSITGPASGTITEGESGTYTVRLSQPAASDVTVQLAYTGTATDGRDYSAVTSVTVPAGQSSASFDLKTLDDALAEGAETVTITVGEITGGGFEAIAADPERGAVTTTITDDVGGGGGGGPGTPGAEDTCLVSISGPGEVVEGEVATGYTVRLSQPAASDVTVQLAYTGTATDGRDYSAVTSVTIPAGQSSASFDLKTLDDALAEGAETITITVGEITGGGFEAIAADPERGAVTTTITDDVGGGGGGGPGTPGAEDTCLVSISGPGEVVEGEVATGYVV
ncbi:MAG: hypothetical protein QG612_2796, partial [Pseudomonadota bacterium]|nr:hypothetical protein [Pseudomonadota bacterium]